jgi:hypothetical protein
MPDLFIEVVYNKDGPTDIRSVSITLQEEQRDLYDDIIYALIDQKVISELPRVVSKTRSGGQRLFKYHETDRRVNANVFYRVGRSIKELDPTDAVLTPERQSSLFVNGYLAVFVSLSHKKDGIIPQSVIRSSLSKTSLMLLDVYHEILISDTLHMRRQRTTISSVLPRDTFHLHDAIVAIISPYMAQDTSIGYNVYRDTNATPAQHPFTIQPVFFNRKLNTVDFTCNDIPMDDIRELMSLGGGILSVYVVRQYADVQSRPQDVCFVGSEDIDIDITSDHNILRLLKRARDDPMPTDSLHTMMFPDGGVSCIRVGVSHKRSRRELLLTIKDFTSNLNLVNLAKMAFPIHVNKPSEEFIISYMDASFTITTTRNPAPIPSHDAHKIYYTPNGTYEFSFITSSIDETPEFVIVSDKLIEFQKQSVNDMQLFNVTQFSFFNSALHDEQ